MCSTRPELRPYKAQGIVGDRVVLRLLAEACLGVVFQQLPDRERVRLPWYLPSFASMFTSRLPLSENLIWIHIGGTQHYPDKLFNMRQNLR